MSQALDDEEWLRNCGEKGWVVLVKDAKVRYRPAELQVVADHGLRVFCLNNANLRGAQMADRFVGNLRRIERIFVREVGPYFYGVYADDVRWLAAIGKPGDASASLSTRSNGGLRNQRRKRSVVRLVARLCCSSNASVTTSHQSLSFGTLRQETTPAATLLMPDPP